MHTIWKRRPDIERLNSFSKNTLAEYLGIRFVTIAEDSLTAVMEVNSRTHQPFGLLHGGASAALAETVGSMAGNLCVDENRYCVGLEINANHIRPVKSGPVTAVAAPLALGRTIQVWEIRITDERKRLICISRLTLAVREQPL